MATDFLINLVDSITPTDQVSSAAGYFRSFSDVVLSEDNRVATFSKIVVVIEDSFRRAEFAVLVSDSGPEGVYTHLDASIQAFLVHMQAIALAGFPDAVVTSSLTRTNGEFLLRITTREGREVNTTLESGDGFLNPVLSRVQTFMLDPLNLSEFRIFPNSVETTLEMLDKGIVGFQFTQKIVPPLEP